MILLDRIGRLTYAKTAMGAALLERRPVLLIQHRVLTIASYTSQDAPASPPPRRGTEKLIQFPWSYPEAGAMVGSVKEPVILSRELVEIMKVHLKGLRIRHKLLITSVAYALPIVVLLYFLVSAINANIRFARLETYGVRVLAPMGELLELIPRHGLLAHLYLSGDKKQKGDLDNTTTSLDRTFAIFDEIAREFSGQLRIDQASMRQAGMLEILPSKIRERWMSLRDHSGRLTAQESDKLHEELAQQIFALTAHVGNTSNMVLDPELDSYYMMDVVLLTIPRALTRMGDMALFGRQALSGSMSESRPMLSFKDMTQFNYFSHMIDESDMGRILRSAAAALREDRNSYGVSRSLQEKLPPLLEHYEQSTQPLIKMLRKLGEDGPAGVSAEQFTIYCTKAQEEISELRKASLDELNILLERRLAHHQGRLIAVLLASIGATLVAVSFVFLISRGITRPLNSVMTIAGEISTGNVEEAAKRLDDLNEGAPAHLGGEEEESEAKTVRDEIWKLAEAFIRMTRSLHSLIGQVRSSGIQVVSSATEISTSARELEATSAQQAASINEVSATSREISASSKDLVKTMSEVSAVTSETAALAEKGLGSLQSMDSTMRELMEATASIASRLEAISDKAGNIGSIVTTITKVADQTNLLSLNAGIEAEKAGEYGLGFSVVAREIRRLADQTATATLDIEQMVKEMQSAVSSGVMEVDRFIQQVRQGGQNAGRIGNHLVTIIEKVQALIPRFEEVSRSMETQSSGAEEISKAMIQLSEGAGQTKQVVFEFNKAVEQLTEAVRGLQSEVSRFTV